MTPMLLIRSLSLSNLVAFFKLFSNRAAYVFIEGYVVAWVIGLTWLLFRSPACVALVIGLCVYRLLDLISYHMCIFLVDSQPAEWKVHSVRRSFLAALVNFYEIVVAFAIFYLCSGGIGHPVEGVLSSGVDALYYSLVTMATLGYGEFRPAGEIGRALVSVQLMFEVIFVAVILPALVGNVIEMLRGRQRERVDDLQENTKRRGDEDQGSK